MGYIVIISIEIGSFGNLRYVPLKQCKGVTDRRTDERPSVNYTKTSRVEIRSTKNSSIGLDAWQRVDHVVMRFVVGGQ